MYFELMPLNKTVHAEQVVAFLEKLRRQLRGPFTVVWDRHGIHSKSRLVKAFLAEHPDIVEFIQCKTKEEHKAHVLIEQGYDPSIDGEAYSSVFFQNANHSVRVNDDFMRAVEEDRDWWTRNVNDGKPCEKMSARDLLREMADSAWRCGDPGMQYDTTINRWHTCKATERINASNPCSEYMFLDNSACNQIGRAHV